MGRSRCRGLSRKPEKQITTDIRIFQSRGTDRRIEFEGQRGSGSKEPAVYRHNFEGLPTAGCFARAFGISCNQKIPRYLLEVIASWKIHRESVPDRDFCTDDVIKGLKCSELNYTNENL